MPRKRMISPEIWTDPKFVSLSNDATRLLFIGLFSNANDYGKLRGEWWSVRSSIFVMNELSEDKIGVMLEELEKKKLIIRYEINGEKYIKLRSWEKHQTVSHPAKDQFPDPSSGNTPEGIRKSSEQVRLVKGSLEEVKLREVGGVSPEEKPNPKDKEEILNQLVETYFEKHPEARKLFGKVASAAKARDYFEGCLDLRYPSELIEKAIEESKPEEMGPWEILPAKKVKAYLKERTREEISKHELKKLESYEKEAAGTEEGKRRAGMAKKKLGRG